MAKKKTSPQATRAKRQAKKAVTGVQGAGEKIRETWSAALAAVTSAEAEMQRQIGLLMKRSKITPKDAQAALSDLQVRFQKERKKAVKQLEASLGELQSRVKKEQKNLGHVVDDAVHGALVAFNIPSRKEVAELTRKVDELSRKIDSIKKPSASSRRSTRARRVVARPSASV